MVHTYLQKCLLLLLFAAYFFFALLRSPSLILLLLFFRLYAAYMVYEVCRSIFMSFYPYSYQVELIFVSPVRYQFLCEWRVFISYPASHIRPGQQKRAPFHIQRKEIRLRAKRYVFLLLFNNVLIKEFRFERDLNSIKSFRLSYYTHVWRISFIKWLLEKQFISHFFSCFRIWSGSMVCYVRDRNATVARGKAGEERGLKWKSKERSWVLGKNQTAMRSFSL